MSKNNGARILPPREPGSFLVGNYDFKPTIPTYLELWRKHGDLITLETFGQTMIVVCGHKTLTEVLEKNGEYTYEHPFVFGFREYFECSGILGAFGQVWKKQRKFVIDTLKNIDSGNSNQESRVADVVVDFLKDVELANGQPIEMKKVINTNHCNIIFSLLFGEKFEHGDETLSRLAGLVEEAGYAVSDSGVLSFFEWLKYLPGDLFKAKRLRYLVDEIKNVVKQSADKHKEKTHSADATDFIYSFMQEQERMTQAGEDMEGFTDRDMILFGFGFLFGGIPVTHALAWSFLYLVHNPDVVSNMQKEIDNIIGKSRLPTMDDRTSLPYCQAVIYEVLRMASVSSGAPAHVLSADIKVNEYTLPKDAWLIPGLSTINWDPSIHPEPEKFNPGRFINDEGQLFGFEKVYTSFFIGPRTCLGQSLAMIEMFLIITSVVQKYDIGNEPGKPLVSLEGIYKGVHIPSPYNLCLKNRL